MIDLSQTADEKKVNDFTDTSDKTHVIDLTDESDKDKAHVIDLTDTSENTQPDPSIDKESVAKHETEPYIAGTFKF